MSLPRSSQTLAPLQLLQHFRCEYSLVRRSPSSRLIRFFRYGTKAEPSERDSNRPSKHERTLKNNVYERICIVTLTLLDARETRGNSKKRLSSWETRHESCSRNRCSGIYFWHLASFVTADYRHTRFTQHHHDRLPFRFTGRIDKLTYKLDRSSCPKRTTRRWKSKMRRRRIRVPPRSLPLSASDMRSWGR